MVTLDFLALLLYFVMPLAVLLYLTWLQLPALPAALSDSIAGT
jgi:antibiotic biosynthesis monooxygenase (ABM) superfamily enzyme